MIELPVVELPSHAEATADLSAEAGAFLKLMADPTRRRIFLVLMQGETCNCEMMGLLHLPQNLISHHLRQLRQAGLIHARRDAVDRRWIYYAVDRDALRRVHAELGLLFSPERVGERAQLRPGPEGVRLTVRPRFDRDLNAPETSTEVELAR